MSEYKLTHLKQLEAESIHIIREVAAEFDKPVMLYSIVCFSLLAIRQSRGAMRVPLAAVAIGLAATSAQLNE